MQAKMMQKYGISPMGIISSLLDHRQLIRAMVKREVLGRYRGSVMGILWSFLHPVLMLAVYTFVFSVVFKARWSGGNESKTEFAVVLFAGMIVFSLFAECINRAPMMIIANVNYVKKVVFPLEILPWISLGSALFHLVISLGVWLIFFAAVNLSVNWTVLLLPLVLFPLMMFTMGLSWFLAALGVYLRDAAQAVGIVTTILMFLSPIFFPVSSLPLEYRPLIYANPLTFIIEQARDVLVWGRMPDWPLLGVYTLAGLIVASLGFAWFQKTRRGFADVI